MTTPTTVQVQIQLRADTAANWTAQNPTLLNNELALETDTKKLKVGNGSTAWNSLAYFPFVVSGGTVLGNLEIGTTGTLTFEGSTADGFETTLGVVNPTADRTINLPNQSGTVIVSGNASIVDNDISASAEIAVSKLADGAARQLLQTDAAGTGVEWTDNVDVPGTLDVTGAATFDDDVTIEGDLTVNGTTTTIDTETLLVKDKNIELAVVETPTDTTADGGGITLKGATDKTITWSDTTDAWEFNQPTITTGSSTAASFIPTSSTVPSNGVYLPSSNNVAISSNGVGRLFVDASGRTLVGTSSAQSISSLSGFEGLQVIGTGSAAGQIIGRFTADASGSSLTFSKSRGASIGTNTVVSSGDDIGVIRFSAADGTNYLEAARILAEVDGTPGANDMPGRLVFSTTADGASSPTERVRITSGGYFKASNDGAYVGTTGTYHEIYQSAAGSNNLLLRAANNSYTGSIIVADSWKSAANNWYFFIGASDVDGTSDNEFLLRGDGNGYCDGAWTGGGADYAEYFEWSDSNPDAEDRRGISVVLDGDKIRPAEDGEDPIGVISGNPSVAGDAAWNKWSGKYLRDEFGTYIQEDYEVTDDDGNTIIQQRRKLNPAYDPDVEYTSREERPEWDCVGLMGKLRIRKGQPTGSRWIKMRDVSDSVEEWLVR